ncbi:MAG: hypothetical protein FWD90_10385 [Defluviitaleaceae bacterium]|nr:hypothetical protein [Defluviitaleaceae bacterium]
MKKWFVCFVCAAGLLLLATACDGNGERGNGTNGEAERGESRGVEAGGERSGRYVEVDITPPIEGRIISLVARDGTLVAFDEGLRTRYDSGDKGVTWTQSPGPGASDDRFTDVQSAALLPDGRLLLYLQGYGMTKLSQDGTTEHFPVAEIDDAIADGDSHNVSLIQLLDDQRVLFNYNVDWLTRFMRENPSGMNNITHGQSSGATGNQTEVRTSEVRVSGNIAGGGISSGGNNISLGGMFGQTAAIHDIATGNLISDLETSGTLGANNNGDVFTLQGHSILRHTSDGHIDTFLDGTAFTFGSASGTAAAMQEIADGCIIVNVLIHGQYNRLFRYTWDHDAHVNPEKTISIWSLEDNETVRAAITKIWRLHPDACITYEIALSGDNAVSVSDAIRTLNTRLLSGRGPDILILDGTPVESYANRGMLLDLTGRVDVSGIYQNLLAPYTDNGRLHVIPTQFMIPALLGDRSELNAVRTLAALADSVINGNPATPLISGEGMLGGVPKEERAQLHFGDLRELFDIMWQANAPAIVDGNRLDSDMLRAFLEATKAISDMYGLTDTNEMMAGSSFLSFGGGGRVNTVPASLVTYMLQSTNMGAFAVTNLSLLHTMMDRGDGDAYIEPFPGLAPGAWIPSTLAGISADTANPDFAAAFIETLLSVQVQQINHGLGLPVTRSGIAAQINLINEMMRERNMTLFGFDMDALIARLNTPANIETTLRGMVWETVERLCQGRLDVEGAVREIEQSIRNYLAERS